MKKTAQLKALLQSQTPEYLLEAHNGISAQIVEEAGFKGIWASSLTVSAALGVRDDNEMSWTEVLAVVEFMSDATQIPILMDGDTGYGDFNNVRRLVRKLEQRNIAGVCIEDKLFPKKNSFIQGEAQPLADVEEFCGKIKAAKDTQKDSDFVVIARTEAFIAGWGLSEAVKRAEAYRLAGADAILVHSKRSDTTEIDSFKKEWANRHPIVVVPTKYYQVKPEYFAKANISLVIWANHLLRSSVKAMQEVSLQIQKTKSIALVESKVAPLQEIFRLQRMDELLSAEKKYSHAAAPPIRALVLAASQGKELAYHTQDIPKAMLTVNGKPILHTIVDEFYRVGIKNIAATVGYRAEKVELPNLQTFQNPNFDTTTELYSLYCAREYLDGETIICYGDVLFKSYVLDDLLRDKSDIAIMTDAELETSGGDYREFVKTDEPYSRLLFSRSVGLKEMSSQLPLGQANGEFIGLWKVSARGANVVRDLIERLASRPDFRSLRLADFFNALLTETPVSARFIKGGWVDIDTIAMLKKASGFY